MIPAISHTCPGRRGGAKGGTRSAAPPPPTSAPPLCGPAPLLSGASRPAREGSRIPATAALVSAGPLERRTSFRQPVPRVLLGFRPVVGLRRGHGESEGSAVPGAQGCREAHGGGRARPRAPRPGGGLSAGLGWRRRGEGKLGTPRAVGVGKGCGWGKGAAGRGRGATLCGLGGPGPAPAPRALWAPPCRPRRVPATPGPPWASAELTARPAGLPSPRSVVASVDPEARLLTCATAWEALTCSAFGVLRGRTRNLPSPRVEMLRENGKNSCAS